MSHKTSLIILYLIILGVILGILSGWYWGQSVLRIAWMGELFLNALKMTIIPLIIAAVISGVASLGDVRKLGKSGGYTMLYYFLTTMLAVAIGLILVNFTQPGSGITGSEDLARMGASQTSGKEEMGLEDILLSLISPNLIKSAADLQLLPLVFFSILFGAAATTIGRTGEVILNFFNGLNEVMMKIVGWVMYFAPLGIFSLVATRLGNAGGGEAFMAEISAVGSYVMTVLVALGIHAVLLLVILSLLSRRGLSYVKDMMRAILTAFGTASSSATLPLTMECAREHGLSERSVRFVLPLGSTVNMNGTALYEAVAAMFIAQVYGINLGLEEQMLISITATLAAVGAAGIPEAGLITMLIVLKAVGLPLEGIGLLLAVDWFLDRFRTSVNVWGDAVGAAVMNRQMMSEEERAMVRVFKEIEDKE